MIPSWLADLLKGPTVVDHKLSASSAELAVGDWFCADPSDASGDTVTRVSAAALAAAGAPLAISLQAYLPGARVRGLAADYAPPAITGLGVGAVVPVLVNPTTARSERVAGLAPGDFGVGVASTGGGLTIGITTAGQFGATYAAHTSTGAAYETIAAFTYTVPEGYSVDVTFRATGHAGSDYAHYERIARYTRLTGGAVQLDWDVPVSGSPKEIDAVWDARINLATNDLQFQTKANSDNPLWKLERILVPQALP
jgi:hypothetical protein